MLTPRDFFFVVALVVVLGLDPALGSELVTRGREPSSLDLPADSSMPVTEIVA